MTNTLRLHRLFAGTGLSLLALATVGCSTGASAHAPIADIDHGWACQISPDGTVRADGTVTNHSSEQSFYMLNIEFAVDGHVYGATTETLDQVDPGETARVESAIYGARLGKPTCVVSDVDRFKA